MTILTKLKTNLKITQQNFIHYNTVFVVTQNISGTSNFTFGLHEVPIVT